MNLEDLKALELDTKKLIPKFEVVWKTDSKVQKFLGFVLIIFNSYYLSNFISTFYPKVYFPSKDLYENFPTNSFITLAHERVHLLDTKMHPVWFRFSYLLPQILFVPFFIIGLFLVFFSWKLSCIMLLIGIFCLGPWPSPWRVYWEKKGYFMTMAVEYWLTGMIPFVLLQNIKRHFIGWNYYKMSWNEEDIDQWLKLSKELITNANISDPTYLNVFMLMHSLNLVRV
jgi:hypothetical protein